MPRKKRTARAVYAAFIVLVAAFVVSSIEQVARAIFAPSGEREGSAKVSDRCAEGLTEQIAAIEAARAVASGEASAEAARARYAREREQRPARPELEQACAGERHGLEALAAVARLDRAAEARAGKSAAALTPVRAAAQSFISGHPQ